MGGKTRWGWQWDAVMNRASGEASATLLEAQCIECLCLTVCCTCYLRVYRRGRVVDTIPKVVLIRVLTVRGGTWIMPSSTSTDTCPTENTFAFNLAVPCAQEIVAKEMSV